MPKSKRDKKISITKVGKKGLALKQKLIESLRDCVSQSNSIYVFNYFNIRNNTLKEIRSYWKPGRIVIGKNTVIGVALGRTKEDEIEHGLHKLSKVLKGRCGLLLTNCNREEVVDWFNTFSFEEYARTGFKAETAVSLKAGPLKQFTHNQEPLLRSLGMPVKLEKGVVTLLQDYDVCKEGQILNPSQAKILELLDMKLATMRFVLKARWDKETGKMKKFKENKGDNDEKMEMEDEVENEEENK